MRLNYRWMSRMLPTSPMGMVVSACPLPTARQISGESED
jgi:hypothetical protein